MNPRFIYDGREFLRDKYHLIDENGDVIAWKVDAGDDPQNVIPGSMQNLGPAQPSNPKEPWRINRFNGLDTYQLTDDAGNIIRWQVETGQPYQNAIPGSIKSIAPGTMETEYFIAPETRRPINPANAYANPLATTPQELAAMAVGNLFKPATADFYNLPTGQTPDGTTISRDTMDPRIKYAGSQGDRDFYTLIDEAGNLISWQVAIGDDPRAVIAGTLVNRGPSIGDPAGTVPLTLPPAVTVTPPFAVAPTQTQEPIAPQQISSGIIQTPASQRMVASSRHIYKGSFNGVRDFYEMRDENGDVIAWAVPFNGDSRDVIPGTLVNKGNPDKGTYNEFAEAGGSSTSTATNAAAQANQSQPTTTGITSTAAGSNATNGVPGSVLTANNTVSTGKPASATPTARKVGTSNGRDTYQLIDEGGNLIQWQVAVGGSATEAIAGTIQNLGTPSPAAATAINTPSASATTTTRPAATMTNGQSQSTVVVLAGLAAAVLNVLK